MRRFLTYHLTDNVAELTPLLVWALTATRFPLALGVLQILALDLATDTFSAVALGAEPPSGSADPRPARGHLFNRRVATAIDSRSRERFLGEVVQIDKRPGHIPGARSAPWSAVLGEDGTPRSAADLRRYFQRLGADGRHPVVTYCGSGVSACMNVLAMERAGLAAPLLYVASWSGWSADANREAATGE
jgi:hypothetical protein